MKKKLVSSFLCTLLIAIALTFFGTETVCAEEPLEPPIEDWSVYGNGTYFEITNSSYLNVSLTSSENVQIYMFSIPNIVYYHIESNCSANSTMVTLSGFETNKTYYHYEDGGDLVGNFTTDENGSYSYTQDLETFHDIYILNYISTIYIRADGSIDPPTAPISRSEEIYTLTGNVDERIQVERSGITLDGDGHTIQYWDFAIWLKNVSGVTVKNFNIYMPSIGVYCYLGGNNIIKNNTIKYANYGLYIYSDGNTIENNTILNSFLYGIYIDWYSNSNFINYNIIKNWGGIYIRYFSHYNVITNNTITNPYNGIHIRYKSHSNVIRYNTITNPHYGIYLYNRCNYNNISYNTITSAHNGIIVYNYCRYNIFDSNEISDYDWYGLYLYSYCTSNIISENVVQNGGNYGIFLDYCNYNQIVGNTFYNNGYYSLLIRYSNSNSIYHNNIYDGLYKLYSTNTWDDGLGKGNYWDDYTGTDTNGDGVGDTNIPHRGVDYYPLMNPWTANDPPEANAGGPYVADENTPITFNASASFDPNGDTLQYRWDFDNDGDWDTSYSTNPTTMNTWYDDYSGTVVVDVYDGEYNVTNTTTVTVNNVAPNITSFTGPLDPVNINNAVQVNGSFTDPGWLDTHTATIDWDDGNITSGTVNETDGCGTVEGSHYYGQPGVYTITLTVTDDDGDSDSMTLSYYIVVYDPEGGFVTGGGWIMSPAGAYTPNPNLTGKANFGFVSKYKNGAQDPTGNTEFQFHAADMNFHSNNYEWLVIAGAKAKYKGTGANNGEGEYKFMLSAIDGQINGGGGIDLFRIRIWEEDEYGVETVIYDNQINDPEGDDPTTTLGGGNIKIHEG